jgi:hypothetical protein
MTKELFGIMHVEEEEVPNAKCMCVGEEDVSLSQPITVAVPSELEEVPVPQGPTIVVPPEEEDVPVSLRPPPIVVMPGEEVPQGPVITVLPEEEEVPVPQTPPIMVPSKGRGCLVVVDDKVRDDEGHILPLVSSSPFFFLKNAEDSSHPFSHKCDRFVG